MNRIVKKVLALILGLVFFVVSAMGMSVIGRAEESFHRGECTHEEHYYVESYNASTNEYHIIKYVNDERKWSQTGTITDDFSHDGLMHGIEVDKTYHGDRTLTHCTLCYFGELPVANTSGAPAHVHSFTWQTIYEATPNSDGLEGEVCSCGATRNTQTISAMDYAINKYADRMIKAAKPGQKITLEFGEFNSFPRYMMEKVAARMNENITFVFKFKQNKKMQTVTIEPGTAIDLQYDWYGPDKMKELYGAE